MLPENENVPRHRVARTIARNELAENCIGRNAMARALQQELVPTVPDDAVEEEEGAPRPLLRRRGRHLKGSS